ncbi:MAG: RNA 2'-phosphotransferase [Candidatus Latescibacterota bacterium]|nr:RNA 2'-phosphotransferase [Candidatus Latescibacterota bacterium]
MINRSRISKLLSLMLRHRPDEFGLEIDAYGYAPLDQVVQGVRERYDEVTEADVVALVEDPEQRRFELNEFGIRALYAHSFFVEMDGEPMDPPPDRFYMGTTKGAARRFADEGISPGDRYYVHLSLTRAAAESRSHQRDTPCVVEILADKAQADGCSFFARGEVVLTEEIPAECVGEIYGIEDGRDSGVEGGGDSSEPTARVSALAEAPTKKPERPAPSFGRKPRFSTR